MSDKSRAQIMRDKDGLDDQRWQAPAADATRSNNPGNNPGNDPGNDPMSELAKIVGQGFPMPPAQNYNPAASHAPRATMGNATSDDWINEIEQAFSHIPQQYAAPVAEDGQSAPMPSWLRSPAVPQIPLPEPVPDPRLNPEAFTQGFHQELTSASVSPNSYYADDAYQLAASHGTNNQWDGSWDNMQPIEQHDQSYGAYGDLDGDNRQGYGDDEYHDEAYFTPPPNRRRGLIFAGVACGIAAIAIVGAFSFRSGGVISNEVPVITADSQPVRVEPETPGGEEVPNTNKAIYEHTNQAPTGEGAVVVDNREQPVDVNQMLLQQGAAQARAEAILKDAEGVTTTTTNTTTTGSAADVALPEAPEPTSPALVALGEPKRVRTVSVRPDGTLVPSDGPVAPVAPKPVEVAIPRNEPVAAPTAPAAPKQAPVVPAAAPAAPEAVAAKPAARAPLQITPQANSAAKPAAPAAQAPSQPPAQAAVSSPAAGSYTVQLAAPGSDGEARNLYTRLQRKHSELAGYSPNVVRAESGGRTIYRLRVGAFSSRDAATALCVRIQATGGQCFVARN